MTLAVSQFENEAFTAHLSAMTAEVSEGENHHDKERNQGAAAPVHPGIVSE